MPSCRAARRQLEDAITEVEIVLGLRPQAQRHCRGDEQVARLLAGNLDDMLAEVETSS